MPQPTSAEQAQARQERKREAKRLRLQARKEAEVPGWGRDLYRALGVSAACTLFTSVLILLVRWRLLRDNSHDIVDNTDSWTAILAMLVPLMLPFLLLAPKRPDLGFRYGTVPFLPLIAVVAGAVQGVAMLVWPWLVGADLVPGTVLAELASDPIALVTAAALIFTWTCVFLCVVAAIISSMMAMKRVVGIVLVVPFLGAIFGGFFSSVRTFENPPSTSACVIWIGLSVVALLLVTAVDALRNHLHRRMQRGEGQQRAAMPYRPSLEELGWEPR